VYLAVVLDKFSRTKWWLNLDELDGFGYASGSGGDALKTERRQRGLVQSSRIAARNTRTLKYSARDHAPASSQVLATGSALATMQTAKVFSETLKRKEEIDAKDDEDWKIFGFNISAVIEGLLHERITFSAWVSVSSRIRGGTTLPMQAKHSDFAEPEILHITETFTRATRARHKIVYSWWFEWRLMRQKGDPKKEPK